jgi:hypothetical protein
MGRMISQFLGHVLPGVVRPLHALWNQVIGSLFVVLALSAVPSIIRYVRDFEATAAGIFRVVLSASFAAIMAYFGISSFLRARKISRT